MSMRIIPPSEWGRDHWSTLLYIETRAVAYRGGIDRRHLRINGARHPGLAHVRGDFVHPTRLRAGRIEPEHDDWDCVEDMVAAEMVEIGGTGLSPIMRLTDFGWQVASRLRRDRANFQFPEGGSR